LPEPGTGFRGLIFDNSLRVEKSVQSLFMADQFVVKLLRADGGCLGAKRRRKTWKAAISSGEPPNRL